MTLCDRKVFNDSQHRAVSTTAELLVKLTISFRFFEFLHENYFFKCTDYTLLLVRRYVVKSAFEILERVIVDRT